MLGTRTRAAVLATLAAGALGAAGAVAATTPAVAAETSKVSVVHGIPGATVDVYVNGERTLDDFAPGTVAGPLDLPAGSYDLKVVAGDAPDGNADAIVEADDVAVPGGANISVVAHLNAQGQPALTPFVNDVSRVGAGKARLIVRHTAAAPAVDVRANGQVAFPGLTNPKEAKADLPAGTIRADVVLAGTSTVALGPANLNLREGTATIVYATGSAEQKTLTIVAQTITGLHSNPSGVPAGLGGTAGRDRVPAGIFAVGAFGLLLAAGAAVRLAAARSSR
jgi:hypothetical protein